MMRAIVAVMPLLYALLNSAVLIAFNSVAVSEASSYESGPPFQSDRAGYETASSDANGVGGSWSRDFPRNSADLPWGSEHQSKIGVIGSLDHNSHRLAPGMADLRSEASEDSSATISPPLMQSPRSASREDIAAIVKEMGLYDDSYIRRLSEVTEEFNGEKENRETHPRSEATGLSSIQSIANLLNPKSAGDGHYALESAEDGSLSDRGTTCDVPMSPLMASAEGWSPIPRKARSPGRGSSQSPTQTPPSGHSQTPRGGVTRASTSGGGSRPRTTHPPTALPSIDVPTGLINFGVSPSPRPYTMAPYSPSSPVEKSKKSVLSSTSTPSYRSYSDHHSVQASNSYSESPRYPHRSSTSTVAAYQDSLSSYTAAAAFPSTVATAIPASQLSRHQPSVEEPTKHDSNAKSETAKNADQHRNHEMGGDAAAAQPIPSSERGSSFAGRADTNADPLPTPRPPPPKRKTQAEVAVSMSESPYRASPEMPEAKQDAAEFGTRHLGGHHQQQQGFVPPTPSAEVSENDNIEGPAPHRYRTNKVSETPEAQRGGLQRGARPDAGINVVSPEVPQADEPTSGGANTPAATPSEQNAAHRQAQGNEGRSPSNTPPQIDHIQAPSGGRDGLEKVLTEGTAEERADEVVPIDRELLEGYVEAQDAMDRRVTQAIHLWYLTADKAKRILRYARPIAYIPRLTSHLFTTRAGPQIAKLPGTANFVRFMSEKNRGVMGQSIVLSLALTFFYCSAVFLIWLCSTLWRVVFGSRDPPGLKDIQATLNLLQSIQHKDMRRITLACEHSMREARAAKEQLHMILQHLLVGQLPLDSQLVTDVALSGGRAGPSPQGQQDGIADSSLDGHRAAQIGGASQQAYQQMQQREGSTHPWQPGTGKVVGASTTSTHMIESSLLLSKKYTTEVAGVPAGFAALSSALERLEAKFTAHARQMDCFHSSFTFYADSTCDAFASKEPPHKKRSLASVTASSPAPLDDDRGFPTSTESSPCQGAQPAPSNMVPPSGFSNAYGSTTQHQDSQGGHTLEAHPEADHYAGSEMDGGRIDSSLPSSRYAPRPASVDPEAKPREVEPSTSLSPNMPPHSGPAAGEYEEQALIADSQHQQQKQQPTQPEPTRPIGGRRGLIPRDLFDDVPQQPTTLKSPSIEPASSQHAAVKANALPSSQLPVAVPNFEAVPPAAYPSYAYRGQPTTSNDHYKTARKQPQQPVGQTDPFGRAAQNQEPSGAQKDIQTETHQALGEPSHYGEEHRQYAAGADSFGGQQQPSLPRQAGPYGNHQQQSDAVVPSSADKSTGHSVAAPPSAASNYFSRQQQPQSQSQQQQKQRQGIPAAEGADFFGAQTRGSMGSVVSYTSQTRHSISRIDSHSTQQQQPQGIPFGALSSASSTGNLDAYTSSKPEDFKENQKGITSESLASQAMFNNPIYTEATEIASSIGKASSLQATTGLVAETSGAARAAIPTLDGSDPSMRPQVEQTAIPSLTTTTTATQGGLVGAPLFSDVRQRTEEPEQQQLDAYDSFYAQIAGGHRQQELHQQPYSQSSTPLKQSPPLPSKAAAYDHQLYSGMGPSGTATSPLPPSAGSYSLKEDGPSSSSYPYQEPPVNTEQFSYQQSPPEHSYQQQTQSEYQYQPPVPPELPYAAPSASEMPYTAPASSDLPYAGPASDLLYQPPQYVPTPSGPAAELPNQHPHQTSVGASVYSAPPVPQPVKSQRLPAFSANLAAPAASTGAPTTLWGKRLAAAANTAIRRPTPQPVKALSSPFGN